MTKHTPGPLVIDSNGDGTSNIGFSAEKWRDHDGAPQITVAENVANEYAALIAAAPDMAEALKMVESCFAPEDNDVTAQKVRAALKKAGIQ